MADYRTRSWMWEEACSLIEEAERRHRHFFELLAAPAAEPVWEPPVNILVAPTELLLQIALPGAEAADVSVQLTPGTIQIDAHVAPPAFAARTHIERLEIPYGHMRRRVALPPGRYRLIENQLRNGCLYLRLTDTHQ